MTSLVNNRFYPRPCNLYIKRYFLETILFGLVTARVKRSVTESCHLYLLSNPLTCLGISAYNID